MQIDTINVIERCHHHILYTRIPSYKRMHIHQAQSIDKSVFEYWTHALSYVPTRDLRFYRRAMRDYRKQPRWWFGSVSNKDLRKVLWRVRNLGPLSIRDIDDDVLVEKDHEWASRKPSKRALQLAFYTGVLTVSERLGMLKTYELTERHFGWQTPPRPAGESEILDYLLDRALRAQGVIALDSICYMDAPRKPAMRKLINRRVRRGELVPLAVEGAGKTEHWARPEALAPPAAQPTVHLLSPFDPLVIQRKRLQFFFDYEHRFEAYVPKARRVFGYFALPVLVDDSIVAVLDLKTDRGARELLVQQWTWIAPRGARQAHKRRIEEALDCFERFQLSGA